MQKTDEIYDVAVIGGGPAGMMAAGRAGELGAKVILLEKNVLLGKKLLITGKGRSNVTKADFEPKGFVKNYGREGDFLLYPLSVFGVKETIDFFEKRGLGLKTERGKRVFPETDRSEDVLRTMESYLKKSMVKVRFRAQVRDIFKKGNKISKLILKEEKEVLAKNYIICTGGKAFPGTGSDGDGYKWTKKMGHTLIEPSPALVPLKIKEDWPKDAQGLSLKNIKLIVFQNKKKKDSRFGELLFTHFGISGPIVLDLSGEIGNLLKKGRVNLRLDLKPALDLQTLDKRIQSDFENAGEKELKNSLGDLLPQKLIAIVIKLSGISPKKRVREITGAERRRMAELLKGLEMEVSSLLGFGAAIITKGGVSLKEIESKTMKSKIISNLFFAGEIINLDGPTGGYNLQLCWTTGYLAGQNSTRQL